MSLLKKYGNKAGIEDTRRLPYIYFIRNYCDQLHHAIDVSNATCVFLGIVLLANFLKSIHKSKYM